MTRYISVVINYTASISLLFIGYAFYSYQSYFRGFFTGDHDFLIFTLSTKDIFYYYVALNVILLPFFYLTLPSGYVTKSCLFWRAMFHLPWRKPDANEKVAILSILVKTFYIPLIILWVFTHTSMILLNIKELITDGTFFPAGYWGAFNLILLVDTICFAIGYTLEHPKLNNEIRSVEPTLLGWMVTLACYPPFNSVTNKMLGWYSSNYPSATNPTVQIILAVFILVLMILYAWASVALGFKASNLTNRGTVSTGPYAYVRHPAYAAKNLAWWLGSLPILYSIYVEKSVVEFGFGVLSMAIWSWIYYMRAETEERHLRMDPEYVEYANRVHYKFIPKIW